MKRVLAIAIVLTTSFAHAADAPKADPAKPVAATLSVQDWQAVLASVVESDRISAREANRIAQTLVSQIQAQLQPPTPAPKTK